MSDPTQLPNDLEAYEKAMLSFLNAVHFIQAQLKTELEKAIFAQGKWTAAKWISRAHPEGGNQ